MPTFGPENNEIPNYINDKILDGHGGYRDVTEVRCEKCSCYLSTCVCELIKKMKENEIKESNPKDASGIKKAPISTVSGVVMAELGVAMLEGTRKYGKHNYRAIGVRASVYRDATWRHLNKWWEGEDDDPDSGLNHIVKAIASLVVLRDAMIFNKWTDDRPPRAPDGFLEALNDKCAEIIKRYPDCKEPFTQVGEDEKHK